MRRRNVTEHREPGAAPAGADIAPRVPRCQNKRLVAAGGGWADEGYVSDERQAVVTWR